MLKRMLRTDFLFSKVGFLMGAGSIFNLAGNYYSFNASASGAEADRRALDSDWNMVGLDLEKSLSQYQSQLQAAEAQQLSFDFDGR